MLAAMQKNSDSPTSYLTYWDDTTGSFTDIDYGDRGVQTWEPATHLDRLASITAICYSPQNSYYQDEDLKAKIVKGLNYWYENENSIESDNWWWNDRRVPEIAADIMFFKPEGLSAAVLNYFTDKAMERYIVLSPGSSRMRYYQGTGQGVFDRLNQSLKIVCSNQGTAEEVFYELRDLIDVANTELTLKTYAAGHTYGDGSAVVLNDTQNVKADYSYQEHTNMLLSASYGKEFLKSIYNFLNMLKGSQLTISEEAASELSKILLDGFRWIQYKGYSDVSTTGRDYGSYGSTLKNSVNVKDYIDYLCRYLIDNFPDSDFIDDITSELNRTENFSGNRHFWQSDYSSHNRENYHFSVRSSSTRTKTSETTNNEGRQARYMGDGMIAILTRGVEYNGLGAAYDWNKLPGTTTDRSRSSITDGLLPDSSRGNTAFVGGVSDGRYGLHTFDYSRDGVAAKKSWFMFDDEIACLGAGISSESDGEIFTTINQTTLNGDVIVKTENADAIALENGDRAENDVEWILHDSIGYVFFAPESGVQIKNQSVTGDWHKTDTNYAEGVKTSTKDIFLLGQSHGVKPSDEKYSYIMLPNANAQTMTAYINPVTVLANTSDRQAVWHAALNMLQAAFYEAGSIVLPNGVTVSVDNKCALMIEFDGNDYKISISNPENIALDVTVSLSGEINASHSFNQDIGEKGNDAGKTYFYSSK